MTQGHSSAIVALLLPLLLTALAGDLPLMESVVVRAANLVDQTYAAIEKAVSEAASIAEWSLRAGSLPEAHLTDLSYLPGPFPLLYDTRPQRTSEFWVSCGALTSDPEPALAESVGGPDCPCKGEWQALCNATAAARAGSPCVSCPRACEALLGLRLSAALDAYMHGVVPSHPFTLGWLWVRGNGSAHRDVARAWALMPWSFDTGDYSYARLNATSWSPSEPGGWPATGLTDGRAPFDRTPRWSVPYYLAVKKGTGEYLGGIAADTPMEASRGFFLNLSFSSPLAFTAVLSLSSGELVAASEEAVAGLWGDACEDGMCNVLSLGEQMRSIAASAAHARPAEYWDVRVRGTDYVVLAQTLTNGWKLWFFVLRSDAFPKETSDAGKIAASVVVPVGVLSAAFVAVIALHSRRMQRRVRDLERQLGSMASDSVIGTPAEDAIRALIRVQQSSKLAKHLKDDVSHVMTLIATNKLFKADSDLREKLHDMRLEKDVDAFLLSVLAERDQLHHLSRGDKSAPSPGSKRNLLSGIDLSDTPSVADSLELDDALLVVSSAVGSNEVRVAFESWNYDVAAVAVPNGVSLLEVVAMAAIEAHGLLSSFGLERRLVQSFFKAVERGYKGNPYHNSTHAADVVQGMHALMCACSTVQFTPLERLGAIIASACHDYGHWGVNNAFLQATMDPIYLQYNGVSVLENMHCAESMKLLMSPDLNFTRGRLRREDLWELHRVVSQLVLATDMSRHLEITSQFSTRVTAGKVDGANKADRLLVLQMMIKAADVSNPTRPWAACRRWAQCVMSEFFGQGDREREEGLTVSPFMDRQTADTAKCQLAFIKFIVRPMSELVHHISPGVSRDMLANIEGNAAKWSIGGLEESCKSGK
eukprot:m51a1_g4849 putative achain crystal structure of unliganded pde4c2 (875) ;mRNA; r:259411-262551